MNKAVTTIAAAGMTLAAATADIDAAGATKGVLREYAGLVTEKTPGWRFEASGGTGGQTFNPLEGW